MIEDSTLAEGVQHLIADQTGDGTVHVLQQLSGGMSREAWLLDVSLTATDHRCVIMRKRTGGLIEADTATEAGLLENLSSRGLLVPRILWTDLEGRYLGRPSFIMERMPGSADPRSLYGRDSLREHIDDQFVDFLVDLHSIPALDLFSDALPNPKAVATLQAEHWESLVSRPDFGAFPALAEIAKWLRERAPIAERVSVVHGDFRYGNFLFDDDGLTGVLDWELAHVGDPVEDLVWAFRPFRRGTAPDRSLLEVVRTYESRAGVHIDRRTLWYYRVLSEFKTAVIYLSGIHSHREMASIDLTSWIPSQLIACGLRQALYWIDELEARSC